MLRVAAACCPGDVVQGRANGRLTIGAGQLLKMWIELEGSALVMGAAHEPRDRLSLRGTGAFRRQSQQWLKIADRSASEG